MELIFESTTNLGGGVNPAAIHLATNEIFIFYVADGRLMAKVWAPASGDVPWGTPVFGTSMIATRDKALSLYRLKNVPRVGMMGAWHQDQIMSGEKVLSPERQRFAIWDALNDITPYLESGELRLDLDNLVSSARFSFQNPSDHIAGERDTRMTPGNKIELFFTAGDSDDYPMGVYYVDRVDYGVASDTISVECRNISGKVLKDQKFDGLYSYPKDVYAYVVEDLLTNAGVSNFEVQQPADPLTAWQMGIEYPSDMDILTGLLKLIQMALNWQVRETMDGQILAGSALTYDLIKNMNSKYTFQRGSDLYSRGITRDDQDVYSKICYQSKVTSTGATLRAYTNVVHAFDWAYAPHKTLYVNAPDDTDLTELQALSDDLAARMAFSGILESFTGPFRPHILPGDEAEIVDVDGNHLLGLITTVSHGFGKGGFSTSFTVDSAGVMGRPQLRDLIQSVSGSQKDTSVKRLY